MLHQDLSAVPLFPSPHTVRSYHHLQQPVVLPTLQDLKLQGITMSNGARISLVYFCKFHTGPCGAVIECLHMSGDMMIMGSTPGGILKQQIFIIFSVVGNNVQLVLNFEVLTVMISRILSPMNVFFLQGIYEQRDVKRSVFLFNKV